MTTSSKATKGFGLVEAIVAAAILVIVITSVAPTLMGLIRINRLNEQRAGAGYAAQRVLDDIRQKNFKDWPASGTEDTVDTGQITYDYILTYCATGSDEFCRTDVRQARVEIFYQDEMLYDVEVVYTNDLGNEDRNETE